MYEFQIFLIYLLHFINNIWVGSLFIKTGLSPFYVIEMIIKFCVSLEILLLARALGQTRATIGYPVYKRKLQSSIVTFVYTQARCMQ